MDDVCYECSGLGDDYFLNVDGEWECWCPFCWVTRLEEADDE